MEKYEKLFKGLKMCAGPECSEECPYHGETRGGKTCRAWLLNDAAAALALEKAKKPAPVALEVVGGTTKLIADANYWRGQAEALKWRMLREYGDLPVEGLLEAEAERMEAEVDNHV